MVQSDRGGLTRLLVSAGTLGCVDTGLLTLRALVPPRWNRLLAQFRSPSRHAAGSLQLLLRHLRNEDRGDRVHRIRAGAASHPGRRRPRVREGFPFLSKRYQRA